MAKTRWRPRKENSAMEGQQAQGEGSASEQKQMLGTRIFPLIQQWHPALAWEITGILLKEDNSQLSVMLENTDALKEKVDEVEKSLQNNISISKYYCNEVIQCPVCLSIPRTGPIYQCENGHVVCKDCHAKLVACPVCRNKTVGIRSLASEWILERFPIACAFKINGCQHEYMKNLLEIHEKECEFRLVNCFVCSQDRMISEFANHVTVCHDEIRNSNKVCGGLLCTFNPKMFGLKKYGADMEMMGARFQFDDRFFYMQICVKEVPNEMQVWVCAGMNYIHIVFVINFSNN